MVYQILTTSSLHLSTLDCIHQWTTLLTYCKLVASQLYHPTSIHGSQLCMKIFSRSLHTQTLKHWGATCQRHLESISCIIDCFEIFTEQLVSFGARAATYSNYKMHNTVKILIAVVPTGAIIFTSKSLTRRNKVITQNTALLFLLTVVQDDLAMEISTVTKGKTQLSRAEVERSRRLARSMLNVPLDNFVKNTKFSSTLFPWH